MARWYRIVSRDQAFLLPPNMADWLAGDHLVWFVLDVVGGYLGLDIGDAEHRRIHDYFDRHRALIAEALTAELAQELGLPVPQPAIVALTEGFGRNEPDPEIQDILRHSVGQNFGLEYVSGALAFDPAVDRDIDPALAADIVWFDALITNVDRSIPQYFFPNMDFRFQTP
jgi:hypothetical protein